MQWSSKIEEQIEAGRLKYTCNCGWVDTVHISEEQLSLLWEQLLKQSGKQSRLGGGYKVKFRLAQGTTIFGIPLEGHVDGEYFVSYDNGLKGKGDVYKAALKVARERALSIMMDVAERFETMQDSWLQEYAVGSGFSAEDLVSDLVGLYDVVKGTNWVQLCQPLTKKQSMEMYKKWGFPPDKKTWTPPDLSAECADCLEKTGAGTGKFPIEYQSISKAPWGPLFRPWRVGRRPDSDELPPDWFTGFQKSPSPPF